MDTQTTSFPAIERLQPARAGERLLTLDVLRGIAIVGMIIVNTWMWFSGVFFRFPEIALEMRRFTLDAVVHHTTGVLLSGKLLVIFAFLFGLGFAMQLVRAEERGASIISLYCRRLTVLLAFGMVHATLLWYGDILIPYAVLGFALLLFRARGDRTLLACAGILLVAVPLVVGALPLVKRAAAPPPVAQTQAAPAAAPSAEAAQKPPPPPVTDFRQEMLGAFRSGDPAQIAAANVRMLELLYQSTMTSYLVRVFGLFLLGYWAGRKRIFENVEAHRTAFRRVAAWGIGVGLAASATGQFLQTLWFSGPMGSAPDWAPLALVTFRTFGVVPLGAGYLCALTLLLQRKEWQQRLAAFAPVGRMAVTNYLAATVLGIFAFYLTGLVGRVGITAAVSIALAIVALQMAWSRWWLARYQFGPVEWLWRSLAYGAPQRMRIATERGLPRAAGA